MACKPARTRRAFGAVEQLRSGRYRARYRDPATTAWISAPNTFPSKIDAEGWLADERRLIDLNLSPPWNAKRAPGHDSEGLNQLPISHHGRKKDTCLILAQT